MTLDISHRELRDEIKKTITEYRRESAAGDAMLTARLDLLTERLDQRATRFERLERLLEEAGKDRTETHRMISALFDRLVALESARAIVEGVDSELTERALRWRRRAGAVLLFLFGQGGALVVLLWWFSRNPPSGGPGL